MSILRIKNNNTCTYTIYTDNFSEFPFLKEYFSVFDITPMHIPVIIANTRTVVSMVNGLNDSYGLLHTPLIELNKGINYCDDDEVADEVKKYGISSNVAKCTKIFINTDLIGSDEEFEEVVIHEVSHAMANRFWGMTRKDREGFLDHVKNIMDEENNFKEKFIGEKNLIYSQLTSGLAIREISACYYAMYYELKKHGPCRLLKNLECSKDFQKIHSENTLIQKYNVNVCNCIAIEILLADELYKNNKKMLGNLKMLEKIINEPQSYDEIMKVSSILSAA